VVEVVRHHHQPVRPLGTRGRDDTEVVTQIAVRFPDEPVLDPA
jgi:hypothetical protein